MTNIADMKKKYLAGCLVLFVQLFAFGGWGQAPVVVSFEPADDATGVSVTQSLAITFNQAVRIRNANPTSGNQFIKLMDEDGIAIAFVRLSSTGVLTTSNCSININKSIHSETVTITLDEPLTEVYTYYITITSQIIESTSGVAFSGFTDSETWNFTTGSAPVPPLVQVYTPAQGATNVSLDTSLKLDFDQPIQFGASGFMSIKNENGTEFQGFGQGNGNLSVSGNTLTINHIAFEEAKTYYITMTEGFIKSSTTGASYPGISGENTWRFTTQSLAPITTFSITSGTQGVSLYPSIEITFSKTAIFEGGAAITSSNVKNIVSSFSGSNGTSLTASDFDATVNPTSTVIKLLIRNRLNSNVTYTLTLNKVQSTTGELQSTSPQTIFTTATYNVWQGITNNSWAEGSNWKNGYNAEANILIEGTAVNYPILTSSVTTNSVILEPGAELTIDGGGSLSVTTLELVANNGTYGQPSVINNGTLNAGTIRLRQRISDFNLDYFFSSPFTNTTIVSAADLWKKDYDPYKWTMVSLSTPLVPGQGYVSYNTSGTDLILEGTTFNSSSVGVQTVRTSTNYGWHLAGNPFPSAIQWSALQKTNLKNHFYIRLNDQLRYGIYSEDNGGVGINLISGEESIIPPFHAFFVQTVSEQSEGSLVIPPTARVHSNANYLKSANINETPVVKLAARLGNIKDETAMVFKSNGSMALQESDSEKLLSTSNAVIDLFSIASNGKQVAIKTLPQLGSERIIIPIGFDAPSIGSYGISLASIKNVPDTYQILIEDNGTFSDLREKEYLFQATTKGINTTRLKIHFVPQQATGLEQNVGASKIAVYPIGHKVFAKGYSLSGSRFHLYDISGKLISEGDATLLQEEGADLPTSGVYVLQILTEGKVHSYKILQGKAF